MEFSIRGATNSAAPTVEERNENITPEIDKNDMMYCQIVTPPMIFLPMPMTGRHCVIVRYLFTQSSVEV